MRNFSNVFQGIEGGFLGNLTLSKTQGQLITAARIKIQDWLRQGVSERLRAIENIGVEPRFMSQGSAVYKTRNKPCFVPPQQTDHDLGCYLPLSIAKDISAIPTIASKVFFTIVDDLLERLVKKEKWSGIDTSKKTCSRVIVNSEIHIDIPLYAIPDTEFTTIRERIDKSTAHENFSIIQSKRIASWRSVDIKKVLLAHRELNWKESDPRKLNEYFRKEFLYKGEQLRRICRYLKAWRDYQWQDNGPTSIYLMFFADKTIDAEIDRDDIALFNVLQGIHQLLSDDTYQVINPTDPKEIIDISDADREKLKKLSKSFSDDLKDAINYDTIPDEKATGLIRKNLGNRFPMVVISPTPPSVRETVFSTPISHTEERKPSTRTRAG
jgi:hypothetical protein